jgi:hypothetical protein
LLWGEASFGSHSVRAFGFEGAQRVTTNDGWTFVDRNGDGRIDIESGPGIHVVDRDFDGQPDLVGKFDASGRIAEIWSRR